MKVKPLNDMVLIEPLTEEAKTASGIILVPQVQKRKPKKGRVVKTADTILKEDEIVLYPQGTGTEVLLDGKTYELVNVKSILMVV
jgi:chaperonin GroES